MEDKRYRYCRSQMGGDPSSGSASGAGGIIGWQSSLIALLLSWAIIGVIALTEGPGLGDHEVIVAQTARQMIRTGEWLVPHYLDTPFLNKPPLMPWLVGIVSLAGPRDAALGLPVTDLTARLPSVLATLLTIGVVFRLGRTMFDRWMGWIAAFVYATSVGALLFAVNATAEAVLTFFCTWAFAEFWWAQQARTTGRRIRHLICFYLALGLGMLTKGPAPMIMTALPIAAWWWLDRPTRLLAAGGVRSIGAAARLGVAQAGPRLWAALVRVGLVWGGPLFLLVFAPWMIHVGLAQEHAWEYWRYEYLERMEGDYAGVGNYRIWYYLPILLGLMLPWSLSLPEALAAPFLRGYRRHRQPLSYAWFWVVIGVLFMSVMSFKKSYYVVPALPGLALLLAPVLNRFFFSPEPVNRRRATTVVALIVVMFCGAWLGLWRLGAVKYPEIWQEPRTTWGLPLCAALAVVGVAVAGGCFIREQRFKSFITVGAMCVVVFVFCWILMGSTLANLEAPTEVVEGLKAARVSPDSPVYWAGIRPDGRVAFYGDREQWVRQVVDPYKLIAEDDQHDGTDDLRRKVGTEVCTLLESSSPAHVVMKRGQFEMLMLFFKPPARELFFVDRGEPGKDEDDWVVVTNVGAPGR